MNFFKRGQMVPPFEKAAFSTPVGEMSAIVHSKFGYHLIKVTGKKEASKLKLEDVKEDIKKLRTKELIERIKDPSSFIKDSSGFKEIILGINPTTEGEATTLYLERVLKPLKIKTTRLGRGLPIGGELEYADEETLSSALEGRK